MRSDFSSSSLVRQLGAWAPVDADASGVDFAERLGLWLNAFDAIGLQAAHQSIRAVRGPAPARAADARAARPEVLDEDLQRVRAALAHAIARELAPEGNAPEGEPGYAPYRQRHLELQRQMEQLAAPLRDHVRQLLSRVSPRLRQLAALDAAMEHVLAAREQALLPAAAQLMARRFDELREAAAAGWLDAFRRDWRQALLAEVDLRLAPVAGLIEALRNESTHRP